MTLNRREVLKGGLSSLGFMALNGLPVFAAPQGWKPKKKPNLVFGVVSDTHMRCHYDGKRFYSRYDVYFDDQALVEVMKVFKRAGVDAILHCGDVTDNGMVREMEFYKEAWDKVYGIDPRLRRTSGERGMGNERPSTPGGELREGHRLAGVPPRR